MVDRGLEARQFQVDVLKSAFLLPILPVLAGETLQHVRQRLVFVRQEDGHAVGTVAIGKYQILAEIVVGIIECLPLPHHRHDGARRSEGFVACVFLVKLRRPAALEADSVQQIADSIRIEGVFV